MKLSKGKGRRQHPDGQERRIRPFWVLVILGSLAAIVGLALFLTREDPHALMREGEALLERDPQRAGKLLERSVTLAGGEFPRAQLLLWASKDGGSRLWDASA